MNTWNLCIRKKLFSLLESSTTFDDSFRVTSKPFILDFNSLICELDNFMLKCYIDSFYIKAKNKIRILS